MKAEIATSALALVMGSSLVLAQTSVPGTLEHPAESLSPPPLTAPSSQLQLTVAQRTAIRDAVTQEGKKVVVGTDFVVQVGGPVPPQLELYILPDRALATVPAAKSVKYTQVQSQIVLVDPTTMRVVDVIPQ